MFFEKIGVKRECTEELYFSLKTEEFKAWQIF